MPSVGQTIAVGEPFTPAGSVPDIVPSPAPLPTPVIPPSPVQSAQAAVTAVLSTWDAPVWTSPASTWDKPIWTPAPVAAPLLTPAPAQSIAIDLGKASWLQTPVFTTQPVFQEERERPDPRESR